MIRLFEIDDKYELQLNKAWLLLVPAFAQIIKKDKGSDGDYRGDKKLMAKKKLGFIYLMLDFASPLRELDDFERRERAMEYLSLTEKDLNDPDLAEGMATYEKLQYENARSLKTLRAVKRGLEAMDNYFENINFEDKDKQGKLLFSPKEYVANISEVEKAYQSLGKLEDSIMEQLTQSDQIRGDVDLGDMEEGRQRFTELLTQAESKARQKALDQAIPEEDVDLSALPLDEDETYQVVNRPPAKPITGPAYKDYGNAVRAVLADEAEEEPEDGLS